MDNTLKIFKCGCGGEGIVIDNAYEENSIDFALWTNGLFGGYYPMTWKQRFRWCWHILKTGKVWTDAIILEKETAKALANEILKKCKEMDDKEIS